MSSSRPKRCCRLVRVRCSVATILYVFKASLMWFFASLRFMLPCVFLCFLNDLKEFFEVLVCSVVCSGLASNSTARLVAKGAVQRRRVGCSIAARFQGLRFSLKLSTDIWTYRDLSRQETPRKTRDCKALTVFCCEFEGSKRTLDVLGGSR